MTDALQEQPRGQPGWGAEREHSKGMTRACPTSCSRNRDKLHDSRGCAFSSLPPQHLAHLPASSKYSLNESLPVKRALYDVPVHGPMLSHQHSPRFLSPTPSRPSPGLQAPLMQYQAVSPPPKGAASFTLKEDTLHLQRPHYLKFLEERAGNVSCCEQMKQISP